MLAKVIKKETETAEERKRRIFASWWSLLNKSRAVADPWSSYHLELLPAEIVKRHRYMPNYLPDGADTHTGQHQWVTDEVLVKMSKESFISGAMRLCYRMKKLPQIPNKHAFHGIRWKAAHNYVGKMYKNPQTDRKQYFDDVMMQAEAHHWAVLFNQKKPPKPIEMIAAVVIEFVNRKGSPLFCAERFIDGDYVKHNSNVGFVEPVHSRLTPQAFSHSSFASSGGRLMVIDVQGVNDLYTDPQIHSASRGFGGGDLGHRGMALFFLTHTCNYVCHAVELSPFDLAPPSTSTATPAGFCRGLSKQLFDSLFDFQHGTGTRKNKTSQKTGSRNGNTKSGKILSISNIGLVHYELANLNVEPPADYDITAGPYKANSAAFARAWYHLHRAAQGLVPDALYILAKAYAGDRAGEEADEGDNGAPAPNDLASLLAAKPDLVADFVAASLAPAAAGASTNDASKEADKTKEKDVKTPVDFRWELARYLWKCASDPPCSFPPAMLKLATAYHKGDDQLKIKPDWGIALRLYTELFRLKDQQAKEEAEAAEQEAAEQEAEQGGQSSVEIIKREESVMEQLREKLRPCEGDTVMSGASGVGSKQPKVRQLELCFHEIRKAMGDLVQQGGRGVPCDVNAALEYYTEAATLAMKHHDMFFANQCLALVAKFTPDEE